MLSWILLLVLVCSTVPQLCSCSCRSAAANWELEEVPDTGACLYFQHTGARSKLDRNNAATSCASAVDNVSDVASLPLLKTQQEMFFLLRTLAVVGSGYWTVWTDATCNGTNSRFYWSDNTAVSSLSSVACNSSQGVAMEASVSPAADGYQTNINLVATQLTVNATPVCQYKLPQCNMSSLTGYDASKMQPSVTPYAGRLVKANCAPGFFRISENPGSTASATRNLYYCMHQADSSIGQGVLIANDSDATVQPCQSMHCKGKNLLDLNLQADFKTSYKQRVEDRNYEFGEKIPVECVTGYVRLNNLSDVNSSIECGQNIMVPSEGEWKPIFCTPVKCNQSAMSGAYDPGSMTMYKAYDRLKDRTYSSAETHKFHYYPNTVFVRCKNISEFFEDRQYSKTFQCILKENSVLDAKWITTEGTLESSMRCKPITCLTNEIVISSQQSRMQEYISSGNFESSFIVTDSTGIPNNISIREFASVNGYSFGTRVTVTCLDGFAMTSTDGSQMVSIVSASSQCSSSGSWDRQLSECIKKSAAIDTGGAKKYVPEAKEAGSAQSLGAIVIVILVVFFSVIVVLDLATLSRDINLLKLNIRRLKLKAKLRKEQS